MKFFLTCSIVFLWVAFFSFTNTSFSQGKPVEKNISIKKRERMQRKAEKKKKKEEKKARKEIKKRHRKMQSKDVRRRMRKNQRKDRKGKNDRSS